MAFFPFTIKAADYGKYTSSPPSFMPTFKANRPEDKTWYAYDVTVKSPTLVEFTVHGMRDNVWGGLDPKPAYTFEVTVDKAVTEPAIYAQARYHARVRRESEIIADEEKIISIYAAEEISKALNPVNEGDM